MTERRERVDRATKRDLRLELSDEIAGRFYARPEIARARLPAPSGAFGEWNRQWEASRNGRPYQVAFQRAGQKLVLTGIVHMDPSMAARGLRAFSWAFDRRAPDGSFPENQHGTHGVTFLLHAVARTELLLRASALRAKHPAMRAHVVSGLIDAASWFLTEEGMKTFFTQNRDRMTRDLTARQRRTGHQIWMLGCALALCSKLAPDRGFTDQADELIRLGLRSQDRSGYFRELGGPDTNYNAKSIVAAQQWLIHFPDHPLADEVNAAIDRSIAWQVGKTNADGHIDDSENTRTGYAGEARVRARRPARPTDKIKGPGYPNTVRALAIWGLIQDREGLLECAARLWDVRGQWDANPDLVTEADHDLQPTDLATGTGRRPVVPV